MRDERNAGKTEDNLAKWLEVLGRTAGVGDLSDQSLLGDDVRALLDPQRAVSEALLSRVLTCEAQRKIVIDRLNHLPQGSVWLRASDAELERQALDRWADDGGR